MTTALLVMDFQNGIVERLGSPDVLAAADRAVEAARAASIPVVFVRVAFRPGFPEVAESNLGFGGLAANGGEAMTVDHPATQIHADLAPRPDEPVVVKRRVSAFSGSDLEVLLRGLGADSLVLAGISTSGVVLSTLRQAADLDYKLTVLADACADGDADVHSVLTEKVFPRQATVTSVDEWSSAVA
ncbi:cysteine hydrolase [Tsukamurella sp. 8F]|uniref:cysteine hydrolase family protein n=1 Tax=unclassified Tsukamurella TaxID=2633480 RepID=UPI0023B99F18|nr:MULTISPECIES: isochorismatase family cysteine hydrolase [unclassified Tsukamurella]MDF0531534.1 cysteine hydrolase [Tsukamurella sp. 8J]MDF0588854.1 cysteine hydrolase [Tsukamurella sp. 8F]